MKLQGRRPEIVLIVAVWLAGICAMPTRALAQLEPLPPRPPTHQLPQRPEKSDGDAVGGHIELHLDKMEGALWAEVEWQGELGSWYRVDGWRGHLRPAGFDRWYVSHADLGKGPYRWQVYAFRDGPLLATSPPFDLPDQPEHTVKVELALPAYVESRLEFDPAAGWSESSANFGGAGSLIYSIPKSQDIPSPHSGEYAAWLGGANEETSRLTLQLTIPDVPSSTLAFVYQVASYDFCGFDIARIRINEEVVLQQQLCADEANRKWRMAQIDLAPFLGQEVQLTIEALTDASDISNFFIDSIVIRVPDSEQAFPDG